MADDPIQGGNVRGTSQFLVKGGFRTGADWLIMENICNCFYYILERLTYFNRLESGEMLLLF